jgi:tRNA-Thr(GGU) m(6)t(6)A37 methyltransferase TsaA
VRCDGMCVDTNGNIYTTSGGGIHVFDKEGGKLGVIKTPEQPANVCFGGENFDTLFITARTSLYAVKILATGCKPPSADKAAAAVYQVHPIGRVHNKEGRPVQLEVFADYEKGLKGLAQCSHVTVVWWFDKNDTPAKRRILEVHPRGNRENPLTGVFATHSPVRPNLIAITTCKVLSVDDGVVIIGSIDAFDGTPILDLKSAGTRKVPLKGKVPTGR